MVVLPPGTLLQLMYLRARLRRLPAGRFIEVGPGRGEVTRVLLEHGWSGTAFDLDPGTAGALRERFRNEVEAGRLECENADFLGASPAPADLVISCMVMEHLDDAGQAAFLARAAASLKAGGRMIGLVPASPAHWGIEDDIAGHQRRYTRSTLAALAAANGWALRHVAGLTYPLSNLLLPLSNLLVGRAESSRLALTPLERTRLSGRREVAFKTAFPVALGLLLNEVTMLPLYFVQRMCARAEGALVLYFEAQPQ